MGGLIACGTGSGTSSPLVQQPETAFTRAWIGCHARSPAKNEQRNPKTLALTAGAFLFFCCRRSRECNVPVHAVSPFQARDTRSPVCALHFVWVDGASDSRVFLK